MKLNYFNRKVISKQILSMIFSLHKYYNCKKLHSTFLGFWRSIYFLPL